MNVFTSMSVAVLIWSLYPLAIAVGLKSMTSIEMIFIVYLFAGIGAPILALFYLWKTNLLSKFLKIQKTLDKRAYIIIIASGIVGVLCHASFILALSLANKGGVSLLYESWPVLAIIATPFLMKKNWKQVSLKEFIVSIIALGGVAIIILSDQNISFTNNNSNVNDYTVLGGYILAFVGAYMLALVVITKGAYSEYFKDLKNNFAATLISEMLSRIVCVFVITVLYFSFNLDINFDNIHLPATFFVGFVVFVLGGVFYTYSLLLSKSPTIHTLNYFVPVLAVIWLWLAGETTVNSGLFIGGAIVTICNVYLVFKARVAEFESPAL